MSRFSQFGVTSRFLSLSPFSNFSQLEISLLSHCARHLLECFYHWQICRASQRVSFHVSYVFYVPLLLFFVQREHHEVLRLFLVQAGPSAFSLSLPSVLVLNHSQFLPNHSRFLPLRGAGAILELQ